MRDRLAALFARADADTGLRLLRQSPFGAPVPPSQGHQPATQPRSAVAPGNQPRDEIDVDAEPFGPSPPSRADLRDAALANHTPSPRGILPAQLRRRWSVGQPLTDFIVDDCAKALDSLFKDGWFDGFGDCEFAHSLVTSQLATFRGQYPTAEGEMRNRQRNTTASLLYIPPPLTATMGHFVTWHLVPSGEFNSRLFIYDSALGWGQQHKAHIFKRLEKALEIITGSEIDEVVFPIVEQQSGVECGFRALNALCCICGARFENGQRVVEFVCATVVRSLPIAP